MSALKQPVIDLPTWLDDNLLDNPHDIPSSLKSEFNQLFGETPIIWPQKGFQEDFVNSPADIVIGGAKAGVGKSYALLTDPLKWVGIPNYNGVIVRKEYSQIFDVGGLWDEAVQLYPKLGGRPSKGDKPKFVFPSGAQIFFKHSQHEIQIEKYWQGLQAATIGIDEVTQFSKKEFMYIMSRNRSMSGVRGYIRATCNPDPNSWVREFIKYWLDDNWNVIQGHCGKIRYFVHLDDVFHWADSKLELYQRFNRPLDDPKFKPKSATLLTGRLEDNKKLLEKDPDYQANLANLTREQQASLEHGNWGHVDNPDALFKHVWINRNRVDSIDYKRLERIVVAVDPAGGEKDENDMTGIAVVGIAQDGHGFLLEDATDHYSPIKWAQKVCDLFDFYGADLIVAEKNQGGDMVKSTIQTAKAFAPVKLVHASRGKHIRAEPVSVLYERDLIHHVGYNLVDAQNEMCSYVPGSTKKSPNRMDAIVWGFTELYGLGVPNAEPNIRQI